MNNWTCYFYKGVDNFQITHKTCLFLFKGAVSPLNYLTGILIAGVIILRTKRLFVYCLCVCLFVCLFFLFFKIGPCI